PGFIRGSLAALRAAIEEVGLRSILCYEVTDRGAPEQSQAGIEENKALVGAPTALTRGMVGAHASFTLSDATLDALAAACAATGATLHVHVAEDLADVKDCEQRTGQGLPARFRRHHLLGPRTLFAHCVHLTPEEVKDVQEAGGWIAHNPRSNMNN